MPALAGLPARPSIRLKCSERRNSLVFGHVGVPWFGEDQISLTLAIFRNSLASRKLELHPLGDSLFEL